MIIPEKELQPLEPTEWAYIAGIVESSGYFVARQFRRDGPLNYGYGMLLNWVTHTAITDFDNWFKERTGYIGNTWSGKRRRSYEWRLLRTRAMYEFVDGIRPYLRTKKALAEAVIEVMAIQDRIRAATTAEEIRGQSEAFEIAYRRASTERARITSK